MEILEELKGRIPSKEMRFEEAGATKIIKKHKERIEDYEGCITPKNIVLTVNQAEQFRNETIPNIMDFHNRVNNAVKVLEEEVTTWGDMTIKERNRLVKILSAMQTMEDISLEFKAIMEQVIKNVITNGKTIQILAPEFIMLQEIFELNDVCIDLAHGVSGYLGQLLDNTKNNKDEETYKRVEKKYLKIFQAVADINFPSIRTQISKVEEAFVNKYRGMETLRINIVI